MSVTVSDLKQLMLSAGAKPDVVAAIKPELPILKQGLDSVDYPIFAAAIEDKYGIKITDGDCKNLCSINDFIAYVQKKLG